MLEKESTHDDVSPGLPGEEHLPPWNLATDLFQVSLFHSDAKPALVDHKAVLSESC